LKKNHLLISVLIRRSGLWFPTYCSAAEKALLGLASVLIIAGTFAAIIVPLIISVSKVAGKNIYFGLSFYFSHS
jgi:hypothetical protein